MVELAAANFGDDRVVELSENSLDSLTQVGMAQVSRVGNTAGMDYPAGFIQESLNHWFPWTQVLNLEMETGAFISNLFIPAFHLVSLSLDYNRHGKQVNLSFRFPLAPSFVVEAPVWFKYNGGVRLTEAGG